MKRTGVVLILLLAFFGLADSVYLAQHQASGTPLICNIENLSGCNIVASSEYSYIFGIPLAQLGVLFYGVLFVLAALELVLFDRVLRRVLQGMAIIGLIFSLYSTIVVQMFLIREYCIYCLMSAAITVIVFVLATMLEPLKKKGPQHIPPQAPAALPPHLPMPPTA